MWLDCEPASVRRARAFVLERLGAAGLDGAGEAAALLVSELVTNAILHARTPVTVSVDVTDRVARVEVRDGSHQPLRSRQHRVDATTGRGLVLVDTMSRNWGVEERPDGKSIWFEVTPDLADAEPDLEAFAALADSGGDW